DARQQAAVRAGAADQVDDLMAAPAPAQPALLVDQRTALGGEPLEPVLAGAGQELVERGPFAAEARGGERRVDAPLGHPADRVLGHAPQAAAQRLGAREE